MSAGRGELGRRLGVVDATAIGLGSMLGAGLFAVFGPAAAAAGPALLLGLALAGFVAYCNAAASAQLAVAYPRSGGSYVYGRQRLGPWWGFTAGWGFVVGKTASCAAMATTFAAYAAPGLGRPVGVATVVALTAVTCLGVTRTALLTKVLLVVVLAAVGFVLVAALTGADPGPDPAGSWLPGGPLGVLQAAGLLFFAFAGYARITTLGEEVRDPTRTVPVAILVALAAAMLIYLLTGLTLLAVLGADRLAGSAAPLVDALRVAGRADLAAVAVAGAAVASLGALLALLTGVSRTTLAMARNRDLPSVLARVDDRFEVPRAAQLAVGAAVCGLVLTVDLRGMIGFSSFGVLVYYAIANASAYTQPPQDRRWPRWLNVAGLVGCLAMAAALPLTAVLTGIAVLAAGLLARALAIRWSPG